MAASEEVLGGLHEALALEFASLIRDGVPVYATTTDKESGDSSFEQIGSRRPTAAEFSVMVAFLNNNKITATPAQSDAVAELQGVLNKRRAAREARNKVKLGTEIHIDLHDFTPGALNG